ncbi:MAG TPA: hypothetical protein VLL05_22490 [Terriglobales bacterium]|nr:hypothetical protein [Terriglobales bacterium]
MQILRRTPMIAIAISLNFGEVAPSGMLTAPDVGFRSVPVAGYGFG